MSAFNDIDAIRQAKISTEDLSADDLLALLGLGRVLATLDQLPPAIATRTKADLEQAITHFLPDTVVWVELVRLAAALGERK